MEKVSAVGPLAELVRKLNLRLSYFCCCCFLGTLADRMLEMTGTIPPSQVNRDSKEEDAKNEQVLDTLKVERERGITVRAQSAS